MKILERYGVYVAFSLIILFGSIIYGNSVKAYEGNPIKTFYLGDNQTISGTLFSDDILLGPGDKLSKEFYIENNKDFKCFLKDITIDSKFYGRNMELLKDTDIEYKNFIKNASISFYCEDKLLYSGSVKKYLDFNLLGNDAVEINSNDKKKFYIEYSLSEDADKSIMGMQHKFNIDFHFSADDITSVDNSKTPTQETGGRLIQTGSIIDLKVLMIIGTLFCIAGVVVFLSRKKVNN